MTPTRTVREAPVRVRRTQAERVESMRTRLLDATIACLCDRGYGSTSTNDIVRRARVSRGALAHHFPTKADLVEAAAQRLIEQRAEEFRTRFREMSPEQRTPAEALAVLWSFYDDAGAAALIELSVAAWHRPELKSVISAVPDRIAEVTREVCGEFFPDLAELPFLDDALHAVHAMFCGMALNSMSTADVHQRDAQARRFLGSVFDSAPRFALAARRSE